MSSSPLIGLRNYHIHCINLIHSIAHLQKYLPTLSNRNLAYHAAKKFLWIWVLVLFFNMFFGFRFPRFFFFFFTARGFTKQLFRCAVETILCGLLLIIVKENKRGNTNFTFVSASMRVQSRPYFPLIFLWCNSFLRRTGRRESLPKSKNRTWSDSITKGVFSICITLLLHDIVLIILVYAVFLVLAGRDRLVEL